MWWKNNKWNVLVPVLIVAVLLAAFYVGGSAPGSAGWEVGDDTPAVSETPDVPEDTPSPEPTPQVSESSQEDPASDETPEPAATPEVTPEATPEPETTQVPDVEVAAEPEKDRYQTDLAPEGMPAPVEPQDAVIGTDAYTCTISISCASILEHLDYCDPDKVELVPEDGWVLEPVTVTFYEGESVFHVLQRTCKQKKIHMEYEDTPIYNSAYIEGIHNLYEFDVGELSGWMYSVNGWFPNYGCSRYALQNGDVIQWVYTCDLGEDVGGGYSAGNRPAE